MRCKIEEIVRKKVGLRHCCVFTVADNDRSFWIPRQPTQEVSVGEFRGKPDPCGGSANALSTVGSLFPTDEPKMNPTETFVPTETQLPVPSEAVSVSDSTSGIDPAFKAAMDSYEAFFDEYVAFMKKYNEPGNAVSMLADYASMMGKYSTMSAEMEAMNSSDLNAEELAYYLEVTHRINQKLLTVAF